MLTPVKILLQSNIILSISSSPRHMILRLIHSLYHQDTYIICSCLLSFYRLFCCVSSFFFQIRYHGDFENSPHVLSPDALWKRAPIFAPFIGFTHKTFYYEEANKLRLFYRCYIFKHIIFKFSARLKNKIRFFLLFCNSLIPIPIIIRAYRSL
jgi:hypothetical protein